MPEITTGGKPIESFFSCVLLVLDGAMIYLKQTAQTNNLPRWFLFESSEAPASKCDLVLKVKEDLRALSLNLE